jgi:anti-anti-sigma factor
MVDANRFPANGGRFGIALESRANSLVMTLAGELDLETAPQLDHQLSEIDFTAFTRLLIDLGDITFMDSAGLRSIIGAQRLSESNNHAVIFRRGSRQVQRLFEITGMTDRLTFED